MLTQEQQIIEQINKSENILITFRKSWGGDAVASALALYLFLKKLNKNVSVVAEKNDQGKFYSFLPAFDNIKDNIDSLRQFVIALDTSHTKISQIKYKTEEKKLNFIITPELGSFTDKDVSSHSSGFRYDLIITLDTPDLESLGKIFENNSEFFYQTTIINLDHKPENENFGQINLVDLNVVSTTEILFSIFDLLGRDLIDEEVATCLIAGIISKTRSYKTNNITPRTLLVSAQLISLGARREEIVNRLYRSRQMSTLKLWGRVLARLNSTAGSQIIWSVLSQADFLKTESREEDLDEVIDELITNIPQAKIIVLIYEKEKCDEYNVDALVYSTKNIDVINLIKIFNPIGNKETARVNFKKHIAEAERELINHIEEKLKNIII